MRTATLITFPLSPAERERILKRITDHASTDPADYPGQNVFGAVNWDGRTRRDEEWE